MISLVAAVAKNGVIGGRGGRIPWELPRDARHFRSYTSGKWMLLGRKTFSEMDGWFTTQTPIVLTREAGSIERARAASSVEGAIRLAERSGAEELVVSGGASVYRAALPFVEKMVLTRIEAEVEGETSFPEVDYRENWSLVEEESWGRDEENRFAMTLQIWSRKK